MKPIAAFSYYCSKCYCKLIPVFNWEMLSDAHLTNQNADNLLTFITETFCFCKAVRSRPRSSSPETNKDSGFRFFRAIMNIFIAQIFYRAANKKSKKRKNKQWNDKTQEGENKKETLKGKIRIENMKRHTVVFFIKQCCKKRFKRRENVGYFYLLLLFLTNN